MSETGAPRRGLPRWVEATLAAVGLIVTSPLFLIAALAVRLSSPGPVFFRQARAGRNGVPFTFVKFRSMRTDHRGTDITAATDGRVTPVGWLLRKTKIDELPELWLVLTGTMSFVGPRPEIPSLVDLHDPLWREVLAVPPGLTDPVTLGLRNEEDLLAQAERRFGNMQEFYLRHLQRWKLQGYARYLRQRSWRTDVWLLVRTALAVVDGAASGTPTLQDVLSASGADMGRRTSGLRWWPRILSREAQQALDLVVLAATFTLAYLLRFEFAPSQKDLNGLAVQTPAVLLTYLLALHGCGVYKVIWRYVGIVDLKRFTLAVTMAVPPLLAMRLLLPRGLQDLRPPLSVILIHAVLAFVGVTGLRVLRRLVFEGWERAETARETPRTPRKRVLLVGAGRTGVQAVREALAHGDMGIAIKGFVDDDPAKVGSFVQGVKVMGTTEDLPRLVGEMRIDHVVITIAGASRPELRRIVKICEHIPVKTRIVPGLSEILEGRVAVNASLDSDEGRQPRRGQERIRAKTAWT